MCDAILSVQSETILVLGVLIFGGSFISFFSAFLMSIVTPKKLKKEMFDEKILTFFLKEFTRWFPFNLYRYAFISGALCNLYWTTHLITGKKHMYEDFGLEEKATKPMKILAHILVYGGVLPGTLGLIGGFLFLPDIGLFPYLCS